jgi:hypothetical protein
MNLPNQLPEREAIDPKLAVGSSLANPKGLLAVVFALYLVNNEKDYLDYSDSSGSSIILKPSLIALLKTFFNGITGYNVTDIDSLASDNPLVEMQIEPLQVPLQLFWKIAKINILGSNSSSGERTGGVRFPKELLFTTNMDILKNVISNENGDITTTGKELIYSWLTNKKTPTSSTNLELKLAKTLSIFSEETLFKTWYNSTEIIFQQEGVYNSFDATNATVDLGGTKEIKGTLRNLKSAIAKGIHPYLKISSSNVELKNPSLATQFQNYKQRVTNYLDLNPKSVEIKSVEAEEENNLEENQIIISNKKLKSIIFESFLYAKDSLDENQLLLGYELKDSKIEGRSLNGIMLSKYFNSEVLIGLFESEQKNDELKSGGNLRFIDEKFKILDSENAYFTSQWNESDGRGLSLGNFNTFLKDISNNTLVIIKVEDIFQLVKKGEPFGKAQNKIYYGAPGTGKSHKVKEIVYGKDERTERVTFHPEYDYTSFVGGYKPTMDGDNIRYEFVPQAFTSLYVKAWNDLGNDYYLVIEEINRGNCAEIFGDIFQLLDRTNDYKITPSKELKEYLEIKLSGNSNIDSDKLLLPPNLNILATMNTSDQSLFPMDSAFKRRWDWEYIPINYESTYIDSKGEEKENESANYSVNLPDGTSFKWLDFIKSVNNNWIRKNENLGMDKCLGNYFIKLETKEITLNTFINKAVFYLWNDVFKDEMEEQSIFKDKTTYEDFFPIETDGLSKVKEILEILEVEVKPT